MSKLRLFATQSIFYAITILLVACGGQPTMPSDSGDSRVDGVTPEVDKTAKTAGEAEKVQPEPEPATIEIIPRKEIEEPKITMEPLPAEEPAVVEPASTEPVVEEQAPEPVKPTESEESLEMEVKPAQTVQQAPSDEKPVEEPAVETPVVETPVVETPVVETPMEPGAKPETVAVPPVESKKPEVMTTQPEVKKAPAVAVEMPADPNTFIVTVGPKAAPHPSLGKGHAMGFLINGVSGKQLVFERGKTYTFDVRTDPKHDVYLSRKEIGWGAAPIAEGVTGSYTYKGKMVFTPTESTPDKVYYSCRNHPNMGALIQIVNAGEKGDIAIQETSVPTAAAPKTPAVKVSESTVKQKLMFAEMMINSQGAKRVAASGNDEAKQLLGKAKSALNDGREKSLAGNLPAALASADESLKLMSEATRLVPSEEAMAQLAEKYKSLLAEITDYQKSHKDNLERMERAGSVPDDIRYDEPKIAKMLSEANTLASNKNYVRANSILDEVQQTITKVLHKMLDSQTLVYDLNFATAADEYDYEYKRFISYEELIPIAIEAKKPAPGAIKLMESFADKARKRRDQAVEKAKAGEYPDAIAMLQQATKTIRRALRMVGVMQ